jgi:hypothetical protein
MSLIKGQEDSNISGIFVYSWLLKISIEANKVSDRNTFTFKGVKEK